MTTNRIQHYGARGTIGAIGQIVVIESLREEDRKTGRLLREDLEPIAIPYGNNLKIHFQTVRSANDLDDLLEDLCANVSNTHRAPCLHIECHGDQDGLQLSDGSFMPWGRLKPRLAAINLACQMNLFLVLACCYGGFFAAECRYEDTVPFAWILGPGKEIYPDPLFAFTGKFYTELLRTRDITEALTLSGAAAPGISYFSMSAVGIFRIALAARIRNGDVVTKIPERAETIASKLRENGHPSPPSVSEVEKTLRALEPSFFDGFRRQFFALDRFPENDSRFSVTYDEVRSQIEAGADFV